MRDVYKATRPVTERRQLDGQGRERCRPVRAHCEDDLLLWNPTKCPPARGGHQEDVTAGWPLSSAGNQRLSSSALSLARVHCWSATHRKPPRGHSRGRQVLWRARAWCAWLSPVQAPVWAVKILVGGHRDLLTWGLCTLEFEDDCCEGKKGRPEQTLDRADHDIWPKVLHQKEKQNLTFQTRLSAPRKENCSGNTALKNNYGRRLLPHSRVVQKEPCHADNDQF